jgi:alkylhydroperoxidase/carboxymuconolactone decarboxylase family protein YurZ
MDNKEEGLSDRQKELKERFIKLRGYWSDELWGEVLRMDPDFFEAYLNFSSKPWVKGVLPSKIKELIYIAINAVHMYAPGLRQHIRNALKYGATVEEILEVLEIVSVIGIHSFLMGIPILAEETRKTSDKK